MNVSLRNSLALRNTVMKPSIKSKLDQILKKHQKLIEEFPGINMSSESGLKRYQEVNKELKDISGLVQAYQSYLVLMTQIDENQLLLVDTDTLIVEMAQTEIDELKNEAELMSTELMMMLLPKDPDDDKNVYLEIRAGAGGQEAALFVIDLLRMYQLFAQAKKWRFEIISQQAAEQGGLKEVICHIKGADVFSVLKYESGTHRVQRVPATESQGRIHTSTCTVAILPESDEITSVDINPSELRIDTYRSSGAGGQHVNTTDSAVRITHLPTGIVVECQDERSQHKNKAKAMKLLGIKILDVQRSMQHAERSQARRLQVGSGDRSERIRTYNFPQSRITDHRISLTLYQLEEILSGKMELLVDPLAQEDKADQLSQLDD